MPGRILKRHTGGNSTYARTIAEHLAAQSVPVYAMPHSGSAARTAIAESIYASLRGVPGRVVHFVADTGPLAPVRMPSVVTIHGVASRWITTARTSTQELVWRQRVAAAARHSDRIITVSESSSRDIQAVFGVPADQIEVIEHGIDRSKFARSTQLTGRLSVLRNRPFVLYLGNIEPRKNLIELSRAFRAPAVRATGYELVIAGRTAWNYAETMREFSLNERVRLLGPVSDDERMALMQHCELFVFPSLYEGFGFPVLEALAAGAPVLASNRGALAEVAGPSMVLEDLSSEGIASGLLSALGDEGWREQVRRAAPAWVDRFSWDRSVAKHLDVYRSLIAD